MLHTIIRSITTPSGQISSSLQLTASAVTEFDETINATSTNVPFSLSIDISQVSSLWIQSDQDITIKTNSSGSPTDTLAIKANIPYIWHTNAYNNCLITADVTQAFITNATANQANVKMRILYDATP